MNIYIKDGYLCIKEYQGDMIDKDGSRHPIFVDTKYKVNTTTGLFELIE